MGHTLRQRVVSMAVAYVKLLNIGLVHQNEYFSCCPKSSNYLNRHWIIVNGTTTNKRSIISMKVKNYLAKCISKFRFQNVDHLRRHFVDVLLSTERLHCLQGWDKHMSREGDWWYQSDTKNIKYQVGWHLYGFVPLWSFSIRLYCISEILSWTRQMMKDEKFILSFGRHCILLQINP